MKALLLVAGMAVATALVSGALLVGQGAEVRVQAASPPASAPPAPAAPESRATVPDLERKVRDLEARVEEMRVRGDPLPFLPAEPAAAPAERAKAVREAPATADVNEGMETVHRALKVMAATKESRRDAEIRRRIDRLAVAMALAPDERIRVEEIARSHVERADAIALRAREGLKDSPFGFTEADRALVQQLGQDRARLDRETEQSLVDLVGAERWKAGLKAQKEQEAKEAAIRKLEKPW